MKKRILKGRAAICPVILLAAASLVFSACGKKETEEMKETETSVAETEGSSGETGASTEDPVGSGEEIVEETGLLYPVVWTDYLSEYDETIGPLCSAEYQSPGIRNEEYPELSEALKAWSEENTVAVQKEYEELLAIAREDAGQREDFSGYSTDSSVQIVRADQKVFSFINEGYSYTGGAHGNGGTRGYSFDTETGEALLLSDVVTDKEAFTEYLISRLEEEYASEDMLLEGWQDQVRAETGQEESLSFSLTESGMRVYFSPYEIAPWAAGTITLDIPYGDEAAGLPRFYVHSARQGRKAEAIAGGGAEGVVVAFELDRDGGNIVGDYSCAYSRSYESVMGCGRMREVVDDAERKMGLRLLMAHAAPGAPASFTHEGMGRVAIFRLDVEQLSAKRRS